MTVTPLWTPSIVACDEYLGERTGKYEWRAVRYRAAIEAMALNGGLSDTDTVYDIGAGWTEFDYCLRAEADWKGRYIPIDGGVDGTNIDDWTPRREVAWFVMLEIIEHLYKPFMLLEKAKQMATKGIIISTPNPRTTDVLGMDPTHVREVHHYELENSGFTVEERSFYGQANDSLFAVWTPPHGRWNTNAAAA